ncbi:hypothetical protein G6O67_006309 [Ophiocordyceps sinensis]|uniref:Uncharacterized protein n=1 Tax=Ophiocordyceps sinensis TaxID=72228 RepID=A0A8H4LVX9_9HYPO|nr:hypothetical protein G6O67_006309 [Ophiocordyceps sinensis]
MSTTPAIVFLVELLTLSTIPTTLILVELLTLNTPELLTLKITPTIVFLAELLILRDAMDAKPNGRFVLSEADQAEPGCFHEDFVNLNVGGHISISWETSHGIGEFIQEHIDGLSVKLDGTNTCASLLIRP